MGGHYDFGSWMREIITRPSERDKQIKVGASNMAQPCARHLAQDMEGLKDNSFNPYWGMKAVIGTAVHELAENRNENPDVLVEVKVTLGDIPGYGTVTSTSDQFHVPTGTVGDLKTTEVSKLAEIKAVWGGINNGYDVESRYTYSVQSHINQVHLYGLGQENAGREVNWLQIIYLCRDGGNPTEHIWTSPPLRYDRERAEAIWDRAVRLWKWLEEGHSHTQLEHTPGCFDCYQEGA